MMFSRACEYALQATLYLGAQASGKPILQRQISGALHIPPHFLGKVLQSLSRSGLITSRKGKTGGFCLARSPGTIALFDIIEAVDGTGTLDGCLLGFPGCGDDHPCPFHNEWKEAKTIILRGLQDRSLQELSEEMGAKLEWMRLSQGLSDEGGQP